MVSRVDEQFSNDLTETIASQINAEIIQRRHQNRDFKDLINKRLLLHYSVKSQNYRTIENLLKRGWDVNARDNRGRTPLMLVVKDAHSKIVEILLKAGADIDVYDNDDKSALQMALSQHRSYYNSPSYNNIIKLLFNQLRQKCSSSKKIASRLIDSGCELYQAAFTKNAKVIKYMLKRGISIESKHPITGETALHQSVSLQDSKSVRILLKYGANVTALNKQGKTPLFKLPAYDFGCNADKKNPKILKALLENIPANSTYDISHICNHLAHGNAESISVILQYNSPITAKTEFSRKTLLHYLARNRSSGVIETLKLHIHKYDINACDIFGETPLYLAASWRNTKMVEFLLEQGANPNIATYAFHNTAIFGNLNYYDTSVSITPCSELLLQYGADPQVIVTNDRTGEKSTIFDPALKTNDFSRLNPAIAHLAAIQQLGTPINEVIRSKINSYLPYKEYFNKCQRLINKEIYSHVTLFKLLTEDKRKIARYLNNKKLILKLKRISNKQNVRLTYSYYHSTLKKRFKYIAQHKKIMNKATQSICKIFGDRIDADNIIVDEIMDYLTDQDLRKLCELQKTTQ